jgi:DNA-binding NarL/FixJ family response regulator
MEQRPLDETELEVLTRFANGKSTEEIARAMTLHKATVQDHLRVAARKLGAANRVHAAVIAAELGLIKTFKRGL